MRRILGSLRWMSRLAVAGGVAGLAVGPEVVRGRIDAALVVACRAAGEVLVGHDLAGSEGRIDAIRTGLRRAQARRDGLVGRREALEARRRAAAARAGEVRELLVRIASLLDRLPDGEDRDALHGEAGWQLQRGLEAAREVARLDAAADELAAEIAGADRRLHEARDRLSIRESELAVRAAGAEVRRLRAALAGLGAAPPSGPIDDLFPSTAPR
jgi:hypothetical protein